MEKFKFSIYKCDVDDDEVDPITHFMELSSAGDELWEAHGSEEEVRAKAKAFVLDLLQQVDTCTDSEEE